MRAVRLGFVVLLAGAAPAAAQQLEGSLRGEIPSGLGQPSGSRAVQEAPDQSILGGGGGRDLTRERPPTGGFIGQGPSLSVFGSGDLTLGGTR